MNVKVSAALVVLALLGLAQGRALLDAPAPSPSASVEHGCAAELGDVSNLLTLIKGFGLFEQLPTNATLFAPTNVALKSVLAGLPGVNTSSQASVSAYFTAHPDDLLRLLSVVVYHAAPLGALLPADLAAAERVSTVLSLLRDTPAYELNAAASGSGGSVVLVDGAGQKVSLKEPIKACGSLVYVIDKVLLPATNFSDIPATPLEDAVAFFSRAAPAPSPASSNEDTVAAAATTGATGVAGTVAGGVQKGVNATLGGISTAAGAVGGGLLTAANAVGGFFAGVGPQASAGVDKATDAVMGGLTTAQQAVTNATTTAAGAVSSAAQTAGNAVVSAGKTAVNAVANAGKTAVDSIKNFFG